MKTEKEVRACINKVKAAGKVIDLTIEAHELLIIANMLQLGLKHPYSKHKSTSVTKDFIEKVTRAVSWATNCPEVVGMVNEGFREDVGQVQELTTDFLDAFVVQAICNYLLIEKIYSLDRTAGRPARRTMMEEVKNAAQEMYESDPESVKNILSQIMSVNPPDETA